MIERLMNLERPCRNPEYTQTARQQENIRHALQSQASQENIALLDQLADVCARQEDIVLHSAFEDGFWTAVKLMLEFYQRDRL